MQEKELVIAGGSLYYEKQRENVVITRIQGMAGEITVPAYIEELPVTVIGKKAFLSRKNLRRVILPETIEEIGDWAFAYCDGLAEISLPPRDIRFGKSVFLECRSLKEISYEGSERSIPVLLAAAVTMFEAYYLLDIVEAGNREWLEKWDARLLSELHALDEEGYAKQVLCGEEDYGSTDLEAFLREKRKRKVRLAFLRLLHPAGLPGEIKRELEAYLRQHTKGCESEETWQVVLEEHGEDREYYALFAELSCATEDNFQLLLADIGADKPEMKAYFMRRKDESIGYTDFFEELSL